MSDPVRVSVVIPLYNKARYVTRAVESVLAQGREDLEIIVVDDGSTDGGAALVQQMKDPRIRVVPQSHQGASAARNRGIGEARADLIAFIDADDEWLPCFLSAVLRLRASYPDAGIYATAYRHSRDGTSVRPHFTHVNPATGGPLYDYFESALGLPPVLASAAMVPRAVFDELGGFPVGITRGEDLWMWAKIALRYPVVWSPVEGAVYHLSAEGRMSLAAPTGDSAVGGLLDEALAHGDGSPGALSLNAESIREYAVRWRISDALLLHLNGSTGDARRVAARTRGTTRFRRKRLCLQCALLVPPRLLQYFHEL